MGIPITHNSFFVHLFCVLSHGQQQGQNPYVMEVRERLVNFLYVTVFDRRLYEGASKSRKQALSSLDAFQRDPAYKTMPVYIFLGVNFIFLTG